MIVLRTVPGTQSMLGKCHLSADVPVKETLVKRRLQTDPSLPQVRNTYFLRGPV